MSIIFMTWQSCNYLSLQKYLPSVYIAYTRDIHRVQTKEKGTTMERQEEASQQLPQQPGKGTTILRTCFNGINALSGLSLSLALSKYFTLNFEVVRRNICFLTLLQNCQFNC